MAEQKRDGESLMQRYKKPALIACMVIGFGLVLNALWIPAKAELAQVLLKKAWDQTLVSKQEMKPWPWFDYYPSVELISDKHQINHIVLSGDEGAALAFGPGENNQAKQAVNSARVISGHRDTHFRFLQDVDIGDTFTLKDAEGSERYQVASFQIVDAEQFTLNPTNAPNALLLVTCYPFNGMGATGSLRYVVMAKRVAS